ncbi:MAG TPA: T9SS type A sorting domain-containing protein [bacterium]|nr:T9SS type A sorting domain-containing protein [bacterium]HQG44779.1 T9SS type A sorting domain-containing protein [bacterium]HQJ64639.1 T9SS type A sorting domain-containing protein [bacterium]
MQLFTPLRSYSLKKRLQTVLALAFLLAIPPAALASSRLPIDDRSDYLCYYGGWDNDRLFRAKDFDLVILEPSNISASQVAELKKGHDGLAGTADDVIVIGYVSIGEDHQGSRTGDGRGPCYWDWGTSSIVYTNAGYASWYLDDADHDKKPDMNGNWGSYYVNAGDSSWRSFLKTSPTGTDNILNTKHCDGLFLDTIDTASPWSPWPYRWMVVAMSDLVGWLHAVYPDKYLVANRGLFYFDPDLATAYAHSIRPFIDGVMFESYFKEGERAVWAAKINTEAAKPDGFAVIALDYYSASQTAAINKQVVEVLGLGWSDFISSSSLNEIRYEVFHRHPVDVNPPTWNSAIGLTEAVASDGAVRLRWRQVTDQSAPLSFTVYYSDAPLFSIATATRLDQVPATWQSASQTWEYQVTGLANFTTYTFLVRARDALGNEDKNLRTLKATPPAGSKTLITIDGLFTDWSGITALDTPPNPVEAAGDGLDAAADLVDLYAAHDATNLYLQFTTLAAFGSGYFYHVFFDIDNNPDTGYRYADSAAAGAEFMMENLALWQYTGTGGTDWSWTQVSGLSRATSGAQTELSLPLTMMPLAVQQQKLTLLLQTNRAVTPFTFVDAAPDRFGSEHLVYTFNSGTTVPGRPSERQPAGFTLGQNYPNPFNDATCIPFTLDRAGEVTLRLYNVRGESAALYHLGMMSAGSHDYTLSAHKLTSGIYYYELLTGGKRQTGKMVLIR